MRRIFVVAALAALIMSCSQQAPKVEHLRVEGTALMNESGDTVEFKGMSFGWNVLWPRFYNAQAVKHVVKDWDAELVRAAIGAKGLLLPIRALLSSFR